MKKIFITLTLLLLTIVPSFTVYCQTKSSNTVSIDRTIAALLQKIKDDKEELAANSEHISDLENQIDLERENSTSIGKSYESAKSEIVSLKTSNAALARAVAINEEVIAKLQTDNIKQREKAKNASSNMWKVVAGAAGIIILKMILP